MITPFDNNFKALLTYRHCCITFSGGLDSTVLLHAFCHFVRQHCPSNNYPSNDSPPNDCQRKKTRPLISAIHINHQLHSDSDSWQQHCQQVCDDLGVTLISEKVELQKKGEGNKSKGLENAARQARYQAFERYLSDNGLHSDCALLMAHHANDQAETVLQRLFRGAGTAGAAAIPAKRSIGKSDLIRPLLNYSRAELAAYAQQYGLTYIDDPSNVDERFDRNFIRHQVLPLVEQRWPAAVATLNRFAETASGDSQLLDDLAEQDLLGAEQQNNQYGASVAIAALLKHSFVRRSNLLRYWFADNKINMPSKAVMDQLEQLLTRKSAAGSSDANIVLGGYGLANYAGKLYLYDLTRLNNAKQQLQAGLNWQPPKSTTVSSFGQLNTIQAKDNQVGVYGGIKDGEYYLACRKEGLRFRYQGMSRSLKKWFNEQGIPPWFRDCYPIVYCGEEIAAIPGVLICDDYLETNQANACLPDWQWFKAEL